MRKITLRMVTQEHIDEGKSNSLNDLRESPEVLATLKAGVNLNVYSSRGPKYSTYRIIRIEPVFSPEKSHESDSQNVLKEYLALVVELNTGLKQQHTKNL